MKMGNKDEMTPYLLLVALSEGLPVSMGSGELSSLELLTKKMMRIYFMLLTLEFSQAELFHLTKSEFSN